MLTFRGQREDEEVLLLIHHHPWALAKRGLIIALGLVVIGLALTFFQLSRPSAWVLLIIGPLTILYALYGWFIWWNNHYLLTNERVIIISQRNLWARRIEDYGLEKIQSVASETPSIAGNLLNFGTVALAVIGIKDPVSLPFVEDAYEIQGKIIEAIKKYEHRRHRLVGSRS